MTTREGGKVERDSYKKVCDDLATSWTWEWIDQALRLRTLSWQEANKLVERARALRKRERGRKL